MGPEISLAYVPVEDNIRIDAAVACGNRLEGVAWILEYRSVNPSLRIEKGVGLQLVKRILERAEQGFTEK
jgi:hypothetical protein